MHLRVGSVLFFDDLASFSFEFTVTDGVMSWAPGGALFLWLYLALIEYSLMTKGFWEKLNKPIVGMSPMDGVTDAPWRYIAKKHGRVDVVYTEFVSVEGLWRIKKRGEMDHKIWKELEYDESQRPIVAQLFGSDPQSFYEATKIVCELGFDGVDINMGCPSPGLERSGGGAGLMRSHDLARRVIEETRRGVSDWALESGKEEIPVSVKTRIGSTKADEEWWKFLASMKLPAVAMHGRTFKQLYTGIADWEILKLASDVIRSSDTLFLANGDINKVSIGELELNIELTSGVKFISTSFDGVLIGRSAMGNPWVFRKDGYDASAEERLSVAIEHAKKFEQVFGEGKFLSIRKHLAWYAHGFSGAGELRRKLVMCNSALEVEKEIKLFLG